MTDINAIELCNKLLAYIDIKDVRIECNSDDSDSVIALKNILKSIPNKVGLLGKNTMQQIQIHQWINFSLNIQNNASMTMLDNFLYVKTFLVENVLSLADYFVFLSVSNYFLINVNKSSFHSIIRWYNHIQSLIQNEDVKKEVAIVINNTLIEVPNFASTIAEAELSITAKSSTSTTNQDLVIKPQEKQSNVVIDKDVDSSLDPTKLDIRCGLVIKCWNHPDSDKLLCEEIDLGESSGGVRTIASGIRQYYSAEQLQGRKVLVLANLKERSMAGFKSQGMVLCAVSKDHSQVCLLDVPDNTPIGAQVTFPGFPGDNIPATPSQMVKKKILEGLAPKLRTNSNGIAHWDEYAFTIGNGVVTSSPPIYDGVVS